jgi:hypothetical protein
MNVSPSAEATIVDTRTLTFGPVGERPLFTIDFTAQYGRQPRNVPPTVVDMVITQLPAGDDHPQLTMEVDGEAMPVVPRLRSRRSVVASIPFDDFVALANASSIVERAFDTELEFGDLQLRMLRTVARRWGER